MYLLVLFHIGSRDVEVLFWGDKKGKVTGKLIVMLSKRVVFPHDTLETNWSPGHIKFIKMLTSHFLRLWTFGIKQPVLIQKHLPFGVLLLRVIGIGSVKIKQCWPTELGHAVEFAAVVEVPACWYFASLPRFLQRFTFAHAEGSFDLIVSTKMSSCSHFTAQA